jgi:hypothetical protein
VDGETHPSKGILVYGTAAVVEGEGWCVRLARRVEQPLSALNDSTLRASFLQVVTEQFAHQ